MAMRYPMMNRRQLQGAAIDQLSGGLNIADDATNINDDQLSDCENVWFYDGALRSRPRVKRCEHYGFSYQQADGMTYADIYIENRRCRAVCYWGRQTENVTGVAVLHIQDEDGETRYFGGVSLPENTRAKNVLMLQYQPIQTGSDTPTGLYLLLLLDVVDSRGHVTGRDYSVRQVVLHTDAETGQMQVQLSAELDPLDEIYVPTVILNGKGTKYTELPVSETTQYSPAVQYEGFSLLTPYAKTCLLSDGVSEQFQIPYAVDGQKRLLIEADYILDGAPYYSKLEMDLASAATGSVAIGQTGKRFQASLSENVLTLQVVSGEETAPLPRFTGSNNITVTAALAGADTQAKLALFSCTQTVSYGASSGIYAGARVLIGNNDVYKNRIFYSDYAIPLYVSENAFIDIGDSQERVTGFGKQAQILVIFKEHSMYYTTEAVNNSLTADDLTSGRVLDVSLYSAYFPVYQCHASVGCSEPKTIALCNNKLCWAFDGAVYTLNSINSVSERNVFRLSRNVGRLEINRHSFAVDWNGYYLLFPNSSGDRFEPEPVYLLNTETSAFLNISSYLKDNAEKQQQWYKWTFAYLGDLDNPWQRIVNPPPFVCEDRLLLYHFGVTLIDGNERFFFYIFETSADYTDDADEYGYPVGAGAVEQRTAVVPTRFATRLFDCGARNMYKRISKCYIGMRGEHEAVIRLSYITERGSRSENPVQLYAGGYPARHRLLPGLSAATFGLAVSTDGFVYFDGLSIYYRQTGEIR